MTQVVKPDSLKASALEHFVKFLDHSPRLQWTAGAVGKDKSVLDRLRAGPKLFRHLPFLVIAKALDDSGGNH